MQILEYIQHYPHKIPKEELFDLDSDVIFTICHPGMSAVFRFSGRSSPLYCLIMVIIALNAAIFPPADCSGSESKSNSVCAMDRYLRYLLSKSESAVFNVYQVILSGNIYTLKTTIITVLHGSMYQFTFSHVPYWGVCVLFPFTFTLRKTTFETSYCLLWNYRRFEAVFRS